jgi:hypothetical protein
MALRRNAARRRETSLLRRQMNGSEAESFSSVPEQRARRRLI